MKLLLSFVAISVANAASQDAGSFIRGSSVSGAADDSANMAAATHMVPDDIFASLENSGNNWLPSEYCPLGTDYNPDGQEQWPPENGCYPGTGSENIPPGYPKCCHKDKGNCPNNSRPLCENSMSGAPAYCANLRPDFGCYVGGWPQCCLIDGNDCQTYQPKCDTNGNRQTCNSSSSCNQNEFCLKQQGNCGQIGVCTPTPGTCSYSDDPVCGCDDITYSSACVASQGRTSVKYHGECDGGNRGECRSNENCQTDTEYCKFPEGDCGARGECVSIPSGSDCAGFTDEKVCGCNGEQYKNSCKANQESTSIQNMGNCDSAELAFE